MKNVRIKKPSFFKKSYRFIHISEYEKPHIPKSYKLKPPSKMVKLPKEKKTVHFGGMGLSLNNLRNIGITESSIFRLEYDKYSCDFYIVIQQKPGEAPNPYYEAELARYKADFLKMEEERKILPGLIKKWEDWKLKRDIDWNNRMLKRSKNNLKKLGVSI